MKKLFSIFLSFTLLVSMLSGCSVKRPGEETTATNAAATEPAAQDGTVPAETLSAESDMFTERDQKTDYDTRTAVTVNLNGTTATASSDSVTINGSTVILKEEATYVISGTLTDGMLVVDAPDTAKLQLVFHGLEVTSSTCAALYILSADKVFVTLADGTANTLANGGSFTAIDENNIDGAIFSKQDLTLNGGGSLTVTSPAGHGIVCKDDLVITGGSYAINSAAHGLDANDSIRIGSAALDIDAGKDAIHCENSDDTAKGFIYLSGCTIRAEAEGDGISAGAYMQMIDGNIALLSGGGSVNGSKASSDGFGGFMGGRPGGNMGFSGMQSTPTEEDSTSMKGLKATGALQISGGSITVDSADDAVHSDSSVTIQGGTFALASGDDAIHAEDTLTVTSGTIVISESYEGLEALHIHVQGGDIRLVASDDGLNAAGGADQSGMTGGRDGMFGGMGGRPGGRPGGFGGMSSSGGGSIQISGGTLYVNASGDGIDANGTLEISGGHTTVVGPTQGDTATLDYDTGATITGGTFLGTGASGMAQTFSSGTQGVISLSVGNRNAGTQIVIKDTDGKALLSHTPELSFAVVILSCPELRKGEAYTVEIGQDTGTFTAS